MVDARSADDPITLSSLAGKSCNSPEVPTSGLYFFGNRVDNHSYMGRKLVRVCCHGRCILTCTICENGRKLFEEAEKKIVVHKRATNEQLWQEYTERQRLRRKYNFDIEQ